MEEVRLQICGESGDEASLAAEAGEDFDGKLAAGEKVEGLVEIIDGLITGNVFGAGDPVDVEIGLSGEFPSERRQPGGVVAGGSVLKAGEAVDGEIGGEDDAHVA